MAETDSAITLHRSAVESMTVEAMVLIDEVETYFASLDELTNSFSPDAYVMLKQVGVRLSSGLTRLVDWMVQHGSSAELASERFEAEDEPESASLPARARALIAAAQSLFVRVDALCNLQNGLVDVQSPARLLQDRVERSFS